MPRGRVQRLVVVGTHSYGLDVSRDGDTEDEDWDDYDHLTWRRRSGPRDGRKEDTSGPLVLVTDRVRRVSKLVGASTLAATRGRHATMLHVHADRALALRDCSIAPCRMTRLDRGDRDLAIGIADELEIFVEKTRITVHFEPVNGDASYPPPPAL